MRRRLIMLVACVMSWAGVLVSGCAAHGPQPEAADEAAGKSTECPSCEACNDPQEEPCMGSDLWTEYFDGEAMTYALFEIDGTTSPDEEFVVYALEGWAGRRMEPLPDYRRLGAVRDGDLLAIPLCAEAVVTMSDEFVSERLNSIEWADDGRIQLDGGNLRRISGPGDCAAAMAATCARRARRICRPDDDRCSLHATVTCQSVPYYLGQPDRIEVPDLDGDGRAETLFTWEDTDDHPGSLYLSNHGSGCGRFAGEITGRHLEVLPAGGVGLPDVRARSGAKVHTYEFRGDSYHPDRIVICPEDSQVLEQHGELFADCLES